MADRRDAANAVAATLTQRVRGEVLVPEQDGYDAARQPWNRVVDPHPAAVVMATSPEDVQATIEVARASGAGVAVQSTGHGAVHPCDSSAVMINVSQMRGVRVDPERRIATVSAGTRWNEVLPAAAEHGLGALAGSSPDLGVLGYLLGGGYGWLSRKYGIGADSIVAAEVMTGTGERLRATEEENAELLWALRGGGGNFGVVTAADIRLYPVGELYAGALVFPLDRAEEVLGAYREWTADLSDDVGSTLAALRLPPAMASLAPLDGRLVQVLVCDAGGAEAGAERLRPLRDLGPAIDRVGPIRPDQLGSIAEDPTDPTPVNEHGHLVRDLSPELVDVLLEFNGPKAEGGLPLLGVRQLGGAISANPGTSSCYSHRQAGFFINGTAPEPTPELAGKLDAQQEELSAALEPFTVGGAGLNFIGKARGGRTADSARTRAAFAEGTWERLVAAKSAYDPANLFRFGHTVPPATD